LRIYYVVGEIDKNVWTSGGGRRLCRGPAISMFPTHFVPAMCCGWALHSRGPLTSATFFYQGFTILLAQ
jgi:hypothetical protein